MLAFGWTIERTKEGEGFAMQACARRISQSGQVCVTEHIHLAALVSQLCLLQGIKFTQKCNFAPNNKSYFVCLSCHFKEHQLLAPNLWTWAVSHYHGTNVWVFQKFSSAFILSLGFAKVVTFFLHFIMCYWIIKLILLFLDHGWTVGRELPQRLG